MGEFCKTFELHLNQTRPVLEFINVNASSFLGVCRENEILKLYSATEAKYSAPMPLIGWYIATASLTCISIMMVDILISCFPMKKFWVPMRMFSLNAATLTVIAVAMKLPMDLTSPMPYEVDQVAKVGGLGFLCVMMSNLMPSLADLDNKSLLANVTGLCILVITIVVNVAIQIKTQVITRGSYYSFSMPLAMAAYIYMGMSFFLLMIYISSAVTIPTLKRVLELKYQAILKDQNIQENLISNVEELRQLLKRHWIMAHTSSPQFVLATTPLSSASNIISAISMLMYISLSWYALFSKEKNASVYKNATNGIRSLQFLGVLGGVGSIYRCFAVLWFKSFANQSRNRFSVFKVDKYWTKKLCERKENPIWFSILEINYRLNSNILSICIGYQKVTVVLCKIIELIPIVVIIFVTYCSYYFKSLKSLLFTPPAASSSEDTEEDLSNYVLLLEDNVQVTKYSWKMFLDSMREWNWMIKWKNVLPDNSDLLKLLEKSVAFEGVETFDIDQIQSLLPVVLVNSWSLPIISLTCIAIAIPNIDKDIVNSLFKSVCEGILLTNRVEVSLNKASEYVNIGRASVTLWSEVIDKHKWLDTTLERSAYEGKTPLEIIKLFAYSSEQILNEFNRGTNGEPVEKENIPREVIAANSMYRIAQTIMLTYESENLEIIEEELFSRLSAMIADILTACLTNLPKVIIKICHQSEIEKREESVMSAVNFFAWTTEIIKRLETRELPNMDPEKLAFIDEWRLHFKQP